MSNRPASAFLIATPIAAVRICMCMCSMSGAPLRETAEARGARSVTAPDLARRLARRTPPSLPPTGELLDELAAIWPRP